MWVRIFPSLAGSGEPSDHVYIESIAGSLCKGMPYYKAMSPRSATAKRDEDTYAPTSDKTSPPVLCR